MGPNEEEQGFFGGGGAAISPLGPGAFHSSGKVPAKSHEPGPVNVIGQR
jgi:hypothetical protein